MIDPQHTPANIHFYIEGSKLNNFFFPKYIFSFYIRLLNTKDIYFIVNHFYEIQITAYIHSICLLEYSIYS